MSSTPKPLLIAALPACCLTSTPSASSAAREQEAVSTLSTSTIARTPRRRSSAWRSPRSTAQPFKAAAKIVPSSPRLRSPSAVRIDVLPVRGGERLLAEFFEPLGYTVEAVRHPLDEVFPDWGDGPYFSVTLSITARGFRSCSPHLYVLIPVFDNHKHYFVGDDELEKLLAHGSTWLSRHPRKDEITRRYLKFQPSLYRQALARLADEEDDPATDDDDKQGEQAELALEQPLSLNDQRLEAVVTALRNSGAAPSSRPWLRRGPIDAPTARGETGRRDRRPRCFHSLARASERRRVASRLPETQARRVRLIHGSLTYRDRRLEGFDAAALVEVIEHLDPPRLRRSSEPYSSSPAQRPLC